MLDVLLRFLRLFGVGVGVFIAILGSAILILYLASAAAASLPSLRARIVSNELAFWARWLSFVFSVVIGATYGIFSSITLQIAGHGGLSQWVTGRCFKLVGGLATGVWFEVLPDDEMGEPNADKWLNGTRPAVFIGNHQTELDVLMLGTIFPRYCSVTAKRSLQMAPFLGQFMSLSKTIFIDRGNTGSAIATFKRASETMRTDRQSVYIFPEGTRSYSQDLKLLPFKKGAFRLALQAGVPIVPVVVANYSSLMSFKNRTFRGGRVPVRVMRPIDLTGHTPETLDETLERVQASMQAVLEGLEPVMNEWNPFSKAGPTVVGNLSNPAGSGARDSTTTRRPLKPLLNEKPRLPLEKSSPATLKESRAVMASGVDLQS